VIPSRVESRPFRILSLDGGGIRGAFTAAFLAEVEAQLRRPVGQFFDLIAGTSTGGIIALGLALRVPAAKIQSFYCEHGPCIFTRRRPLPVPVIARPAARWLDRWLGKVGLDVDCLRHSKYTSDQLRASLEEVFGDHKLEQALSRVIIPSIDVTKGETVTFKTAHQPGFFRDRHFRAVDIALATAAAPGYFPHATILPGSAYIDGGLWANNPSLVAYVEAMKIRQVCDRPEDPVFSSDDVFMLSIGTGKPRAYAKPPVAGAGFAFWVSPLLTIGPLSQSQGTVYQMQYLLRDRFHRVDFPMPNIPWGLDAVDKIDDLCHLGREAATKDLATLRPSFFAGTAPSFNPFPEGDPCSGLGGKDGAE
jgi:predicted acylesterase/phospholipase RssA